MSKILLRNNNTKKKLQHILLPNSQANKMKMYDARDPGVCVCVCLLAPDRKIIESRAPTRKPNRRDESRHIINQFHQAYGMIAFVFFFSVARACMCVFSVCILGVCVALIPNLCSSILCFLLFSPSLRHSRCIQVWYASSSTHYKSKAAICSHCALQNQRGRNISNTRKHYR